MVDVEGLLDLGDLWQIHGLDGYSHLHEEPWTPVNAGAFATPDGKADVIAAMRVPATCWCTTPTTPSRAAWSGWWSRPCATPHVLAIKMTVYRTSDDSALVPLLIEAAERGKQAVCLVELKARFDERRNIGWARSLEEAGAHVVHGLPGLKTHAKALLIVRREGNGVRHYVHVGTGNYHAKTARLYEDFGLFTTDRQLAGDVAALFNVADRRRAAVGLPRRRWWRRRACATRLLDADRADRERPPRGPRRADRAEDELAGGPALHPGAVRGLPGRRAGATSTCAASAACEPGVPGVSENIRVVSVVGRFLEHSRVYLFQRGDEHRCYMGSADLMPRNLDTRVELLDAGRVASSCWPEVEDTLERCLADDTFAWDLGPDGEWTRRDGPHPRRCTPS